MVFSQFYSLTKSFIVFFPLKSTGNSVIKISLSNFNNVRTRITWDVWIPRPLWAQGGAQSTHWSPNSNSWVWERYSNTISLFYKRPGGPRGNVCFQDIFRTVTIVRSHVLYIHISNLCFYLLDLEITYSFDKNLLNPVYHLLDKKDQTKLSKANKGLKGKHNLVGGNHSSLNRVLWDTEEAGPACLWIRSGEGEEEK